MNTIKSMPRIKHIWIIRYCMWDFLIVLSILLINVNEAKIFKIIVHHDHERTKSMTLGRFCL